MGAVEREHSGLDGRKRDGAVETGESLALPRRLLARHVIDEHAPVPPLQGELHGIGHAPFDPWAQRDSVDHDVEIVGNA